MAHGGYQAYVFFLFLLILGAPCVFAYISYLRDLRSRQRKTPIDLVAAPRPMEVRPARAMTLHPTHKRRAGKAQASATARAEAIAAIVRDAQKRFGKGTP